MKREKTGFTLVELLVVIAIIALLLSVLIPAMGKARELAKRVVCSNQIRQIGIGITSYASKYDGVMLNTSALNRLDDPDSEEYHPYVAYRRNGSSDIYEYDNGDLVPLRFGCLYSAEIIETPKIFYCPSNKDEGRKYVSYVDPLPPNTSLEWGTLDQVYNTTTSNQWVRCGYEYYPVERGYVRHLFTGAPMYVARRDERLDPAVPYVTDVLRTIDDMTHKTKSSLGVNALFPNGSVFFIKEREIFEDIVFPAGTQFTSINLWIPDPSGQSRAEINTIYYYRMLALGNPDSPKFR